MLFSKRTVCPFKKVYFRSYMSQDRISTDIKSTPYSWFTLTGNVDALNDDEYALKFD